ncbi:MAG: DUF167 domain-containing protein [Acidimicrobiales bacterium]
MSDDLFDTAEDGSVVLRLHLQPGAGRTSVVGRHGDALKLRVASPPAGGRANQACLSLVATTFGVKEAQVELVGGSTSRSKRVRVSGVDEEEFRRLLGDLLAAPAAPGNARGVRGIR